MFGSSSANRRIWVRFGPGSSSMELETCFRGGHQSCRTRVLDLDSKAKDLDLDLDLKGEDLELGI